MTPPAPAPAGSALLRRRSFLQLAGAGGLVGLAGSGLWPDLARAEDDASGPLGFAVVTDTHADVDVPTNLANLRRVFTAIEADSPAFVLNCGDITEYGSGDEYAAYRAAVPDALWPVMKHVPGNHESRWDPTAGEAYRAVFGDPTFSFDVAGLHLVGLDATQVLQEPGLFGPELLDWLVEDLRGAGDVPSLLFLHYPLGGRNHYVNDTEDLWAAIEPFDVRGVFAGHIHREEVSRINGLTQVTGLPTKGNPFYYQVQRVPGERGPELRVTHVTVPADPAAPVQRRAFTSIPLAVPRGELGPLEARVRSTGDRFSVTVPALRGVAEVAAKIYPQGVFGGTDNTAPTPLSRRSRGLFTGELDASALAAGTHRVQVRATGADGRGWEAVVDVERETAKGPLPVRWTSRVGGRVQGALAERDGLVVVTSSAGVVRALRPEAGPQQVWQREVGAVYRGAAFSADGGTVLVPSADHHLHALDAATGEQRWRADLGVPVLSAPLVTTVDAVETVLVTAGDTLWAVDAEGRTRWQAAVPVMSAGRVACDGAMVVLGAGDGRAYGLDARTGEQRWAFSTNTRTTAYSRLIYGPWDATVKPLPGGAVLVATVSNAHALDPVTGVQRWSRPGSYVYAPALTVADDRVLLVDERGVAALVDPVDGRTIWTVPTAPRALNAGPVLSEDRSTAWLVGTGGLLVEIDLVAGAVRRRRQLFTANTFSTPVRVGDLLVVGDQAGDLHAVDLS